MSEKVMIFAFSDDVLVFGHALMNALDMKANGIDAKLIIEGGACRLLNVLRETDKPFAELFEKVKASGLVEGACRACVEKLDLLDSAKSQGIAVLDEMHGHPGMARYVQGGYQIITF